MSAPARHRAPTPDLQVRPRPILTAALFTVIAAAAAAWLATGNTHGWTIYGAAVGLLLVGKLALSLAPPRRWPTAPTAARVAVVVPTYNEDPATLAACLASIEAQTHLPRQVWIVDDGSTSLAAHEVADRWARRAPTLGVPCPTA